MDDKTRDSEDISYTRYSEVSDYLARKQRYPDTKFNSKKPIHKDYLILILVSEYLCFHVCNQTIILDVYYNLRYGIGVSFFSSSTAIEPRYGPRHRTAACGPLLLRERKRSRKLLPIYKTAKLRILHGIFSWLWKYIINTS